MLILVCHMVFFFMLQQLSRWLANRNFVATESLSLADLCLYAICYPAVVRASIAVPLSFFLVSVVVVLFFFT